MDLPQALHSQLYLLAYDSRRRSFRFDRDDSRFGRSRFGYAVRAAMLTDLYLGNCIEDREGKAHRSSTSRHDDPVLNDAMKNASGQPWKALIKRGGSQATKVARAQLEAVGWVSKGEHRMFGLLPSQVTIFDEGAVDGLADRMTEALRNVVDDLNADPRPLALGLIAFHAQLPSVSSFIDDRRQREKLIEITCLTIEPILHLHSAIVDRLEDDRANATGGGCGGGGCGGGI